MAKKESKTKPKAEKKSTKEYEKQILEKLKMGMSIKDICSELGVSPNAVGKVRFKYQDVLPEPKKGGGMKTSPEIEQRIVELRRQKMPREKIAKEVGVSSGVVSRVLRERNLVNAGLHAKKVLTEEKRQKIIDMGEKGMPMLDIICETRVSPGTVRKVLKEAGIIKPRD